MTDRSKVRKRAARLFLFILLISILLLPFSRVPLEVVVPGLLLAIVVATFVFFVARCIGGPDWWREEREAQDLGS